MRRVLAATTVVVLSVLVILPGLACSRDDRTTLTVFAAASLTDAFDEMATRFETSHPDVTVETSFAGSSSLREQVLAGAPADVFASANESNMDQLVEDGAVDAPVDFATNELEIVVPAGNPAGIGGLADFADDALLLGLCAPEVPCGDLARRAFETAGLTPSPDTEEPDVRALLTKVEAGELDAGVVYATDVRSAGDAVDGIPIPTDLGVVATYPIAVVAESSHRDLASTFVSFVRSSEGNAILEAHGFGTP